MGLSLGCEGQVSRCTRDSLRLLLRYRPVRDRRRVRLPLGLPARTLKANSSALAREKRSTFIERLFGDKVGQRRAADDVSTGASDASDVDLSDSDRELEWESQRYDEFASSEHVGGAFRIYTVNPAGFEASTSSCSTFAPSPFLRAGGLRDGGGGAAKFLHSRPLEGATGSRVRSSFDDPDCDPFLEEDIGDEAPFAQSAAAFDAPDGQPACGGAEIEPLMCRATYVQEA